MEPLHEEHLGEPRWMVLWPVAWARTDDAADLVPELVGWENLRDREVAVAVGVGLPVLLSPEGLIDPLLDKYVRRSGFQNKSRATQEKYLRALCRVLDLVTDRGYDWRDTTVDDYLDVHAFRTDASLASDAADGLRNSKPVKPQTWNSEQAGLVHFFDWAVSQGHMRHGHPVVRQATQVRQKPDEGKVGTTGNPVDAGHVKWFTGSAYRRFRQVGFEGYGADGLRDPSYRGRTGIRGVALADYGWESGLRIEELNGLLLHELPDVRQDRMYYRGRVTGKGRKTRDYWVAHSALQTALDYVDTDRAEAVDRAKRRRAYDGVPGMLLATDTRDAEVYLAESGDPAYQPGQWHDLSELLPDARRRLYRPGDDGFPEPMHVWLTEGGMPTTEAALQEQFRVASRRCEAVLPKQGLRMTPHMLRHSYALHMLLALWHSLRLRTAAVGGSAEEVTKMYGDQWTFVQQMLGHSSQDTTKFIYLAPLQGLQIDDLLNDTDLLGLPATADTLVPRVARRSRLVLTVPEEAAAGMTYAEDEPEPEDEPEAADDGGSPSGPVGARA